MLLVNSQQLKSFIKKYGLLPFMAKVLAKMEQDFLRWDDFDKSPRHAMHVPEGVMELMPCCDGKYYSFKYVNGHPGNTALGKLNIVGFGVLVDASTGVPILFSEMTWLTAIRTSCMSALIAKYGAIKPTTNIGIIGCGSQSEFQVLALSMVLDCRTIYYYDKDPAAMLKFSKNLTKFEFKACASAAEVCRNSQVLVTNTGYKGKQSLLDVADLCPGQLIIAIGGDCPGKTELSLDILQAVDQIWVEYLPQTRIEGEIQQWPDCSPLEFKTIAKQGVERDAKQIILFDGVGFSLEDFSILTTLFAEIGNTAIVQDIAPKITDPKDLFGALYD